MTASNNPNHSADNKLSWLLILQAWAMLWVVIGHSPLTDEAPIHNVDAFMYDISNILWKFAYSFHMPLFIMISGYLFYRTKLSKSVPYGKMIKSKIVRLGVPYIAFISLAIVVKLAIGGV